MPVFSLELGQACRGTHTCGDRVLPPAVPIAQSPGLEGHNPGAHVKTFVLRLARRQQPEYTIRSPGHKLGLLLVVNVAKVVVDEVSGTQVIVNTDPGLEDVGISRPAQVSRFVGDLVLLVSLEQVVPRVRVLG